MSVENSFCVYCKGLLVSGSEISSGYHVGCHQEVQSYQSENPTITLYGMPIQSGITELDLSFQEIEGVLDPEISKLKQLKTLDLNHNEIRDINSLQNLTQLKTLYLYNNKISYNQINYLKKKLPETRRYY